MKRTIILDTNFLLIPVQFKVDIFSEISRICHFNYELAVVPETLTELEGIIGSDKSSGKDRKAAKLALQLLLKFRVKALPSNRKVFKRADEAILSVSGNSTIVATQDVDLKKRLAARGVALIILRQKSHLRLLEN